ncbi:MAG TPA: glutathionylspermidine synthase family protein [Solirubrobacteraceae bacterium]|nr:glutathionylspermidine synthase family protein [Solirubrobacteraceae bacterium]
MRRIRVPVRDGWVDRLRAAGLPYGRAHRSGGEFYEYWTEGTALVLSPDEAGAFTAAAQDLWRRAVGLADELLAGGEEDLGLPLTALPAVLWSRRAGHRGLAARLDFGVRPGGAPQLFELNPDVPVLLAECGPAQRDWHATLPDGLRQRTTQVEGLEDALARRWGQLLPGHGALLHLTYLPDPDDEERAHAEIMASLARRAGWSTEILEFDAVRWDGAALRAPDGRPLRHWAKLYGWYWLLADQRQSGYALRALGSAEPLVVFEPLWRLALESKALLVHLARRHPSHPNLPAATLTEPNDPRGWVRKPLFGYQSAGVRAVTADGAVHRGDARLAQETGWMWQRLVDTRDEDGVARTVSVWLVDGRPVGLGIREDDDLVISTEPRFVPHLVAH